MGPSLGVGETGDLTANLVPDFNCTSPAILEFPPDLFSEDERLHGAVLIHILASAYIFYMLAVVCDNYLVPAIEIVCEKTQISADVAAASLMAFTTSAPELFTNFVGTFITEGDIGVGTVVGSGVFNILGVCACCGFAAKSALPLDWYPVTRDCLAYLISVVAFVVIAQNGRVHWYEAALFIGLYLCYMLLMWQNSRLRRATERLVPFGTSHPVHTADEEAPLLGEPKRKSAADPFENPEWSKSYANESVKTDPFSDPGEDYILSSLSERRVWNVIWWIITRPARFVLVATIPDCRKEKLRNLYPLTLIMCSIHIGLLTYVMTWMMTIVGDTFEIPDSVMGLTFIAAGNSLPEVASSFIVARQGWGTMSISNSLGSNTFDILFCLGLPWLIRCLMAVGRDEPEDFVQINSRTLQYSVMMLLVILALFYIVLAMNRFKLDRRVATIAVVLHATFLVFACLLELNVFADLNLPSCPTST